MMRASLGLNDCGAENQVTPAITAFDRPWSAFVLFVPVCLFVVRQAPPKLTPKAPAATFKSQAWDSQQPQLSACPSSQSFAAAPGWSNLRGEKIDAIYAEECRWTYAKCDANAAYGRSAAMADG